MENFLEEIHKFNEKELRISLAAEYCPENQHVLCFHMYGELYNETCCPLEKLISQVLTQEEIPEVLVLECSNLNYVSSTGIGVFVSILMKCNRRNIKLFLSAMPEKILNIFSLLGFYSYFNFISTTADAKPN